MNWLSEPGLHRLHEHLHGGAAAAAARPRRAVPLYPRHRHIVPQHQIQSKMYDLMHHMFKR